MVQLGMDSLGVWLIRLSKNSLMVWFCPLNQCILFKQCCHHVWCYTFSQWCPPVCLFFAVSLTKQWTCPQFYWSHCVSLCLFVLYQDTRPSEDQNSTDGGIAATCGAWLHKLSASCCTGKKEKHLLRNLTTRFRMPGHRGRLIAVMGPSGCGKSTFLNVLSGRLGSGSLEVKFYFCIARIIFSMGFEMHWTSGFVAQFLSRKAGSFWLFSFVQ